MCTQSQLQTILTSVAGAARQVLGDSLREVLLYGSYARGDYDPESDIDIMVIADIPAEKCRSYYMLMSKVINDLSLEYDILISVVAKDSCTFEKWLPVLPFYQSVRKEGVPVSA